MNQTQHTNYVHSNGDERERGEGCERCVQDDLARSNSRWYPSIPCHCVLAAYLLLLFIIFIVFIYERRLYDPPAASTLTHRKIVDRWNVACNFELMFFCTVSAMFNQRFSNGTSRCSVKMTGRYQTSVDGNDNAVDGCGGGGGDFVRHNHTHCTQNTENRTLAEHAAIEIDTST